MVAEIWGIEGGGVVMTMIIINGKGVAEASYFYLCIVPYIQYSEDEVEANDTHFRVMCLKKSKKILSHPLFCASQLATFYFHLAHGPPLIYTRFAWAGGTFFPSCAVVSVFCSGGKYVLVLPSIYVLRVPYSCGVVLVFFVLAGHSFWCYIYVLSVQYSCAVVSVFLLWRES